VAGRVFDMPRVLDRRAGVCSGGGAVGAG